MTEEESKAIQELAKATGKAIDASEKLGAFFKQIFGDAFTEIGASVHDWAMYFRYKNMIRISDKVEMIYKKRKIEGKTIPIPPRYAVPLLQSASIEDDESVQELWACLIANSTDPSKRIQANRLFINILSSLEPLDVSVLKFLSGSQNRIRSAATGERNLFRMSQVLNIDREELVISIQNLSRLGCIIDEHLEMHLDLKQDPRLVQLRGTDPYDSTANFVLSPLAISLIKACEENEQ